MGFPPVKGPVYPHSFVKGGLTLAKPVCVNFFITIRNNVEFIPNQFD
jgi:hypothetical protein